MVDGFLRKMKDAIVGSDEQFDQDGDYDQQRYPASEDQYGDPAYPQYDDMRSGSYDPYGNQAGYGTGYGQYGDVRPASEDPYGDPAYQQYGDVRPASEDPYGDPAYQQYGDVRPASEDPYGDPADYAADYQGQYGDVRPASEDPYGDPADQENFY